ncbi:hypothetical protein BJ508DRAFT_132624 [Ascobolus immersus RN42]|uniref:Uncharacterized protein n=1 Tax=Ascobolus immersus RN42 TaxID=1160509 RepID=A0A3N4I1H6_ASCIM|nr:hypothetical protein BJ508DRAFT_132624 [Ascobolus immersus RN42]
MGGVGGGVGDAGEGDDGAGGTGGGAGGFGGVQVKSELYLEIMKDWRIWWTVGLDSPFWIAWNGYLWMARML